MTGQLHIGNVGQIPNGEGRKFRVADVEVAIFHTQSGEVFATQPNCPHAGGPLADGLLGRGTVICPLHDRCFDLRSGRNLSGDCADILAYQVRLAEGGEIYLLRE